MFIFSGYIQKALYEEWQQKKRLLVFVYGELEKDIAV